MDGCPARKKKPVSTFRSKGVENTRPAFQDGRVLSGSSSYRGHGNTDQFLVVSVTQWEQKSGQQGHEIMLMFDGRAGFEQDMITMLPDSCP